MLITEVRDVPQVYFVTKTAARYLNVPEGTLKNLRDHGKLPFYKLSSKLIVYKKTELDKYINRKNAWRL